MVMEDKAVVCAHGRVRTVDDYYSHMEITRGDELGDMRPTAVRPRMGM
jgi:hypothetical protein